MTYPTSQLMADALAAETCAPEHEARRQEMVQAALQDHYHDMFGEAACPITELHNHCLAIGFDYLAARVRNGDFDATKEETDAWAASPEGQAVFSQLSPGMQAAMCAAEEAGVLPPELLHGAVQRLAAVVNEALNGTNGPVAPDGYAFVLLVGEVANDHGTKVSVAANVKDSDVMRLMKELTEKMGAPAGLAAARPEGNA